MDENSLSLSESRPLRWEGRQAIFVARAGRDDDTLRIGASMRKEQVRLALVLPTLCITYADMRFANRIGGRQADWPESEAYGLEYFDPAVVISGARAIEKFTWIRGAERVEIGPRETVVQWSSENDLVIPKLRIQSGKRLKALLVVPELSIPVLRPLVADIVHYADGRPVGGVGIAKYHPAWRPDPTSKNFDLWVRVVDGKTGRPAPKIQVSLFDVRPGKEQAFEQEGVWYTGNAGIVDFTGLPLSARKLVTVERLPWLTRTWRFHPLPNQPVRRTFELWRSPETSCAYEWRVKDSLRNVAILSGTSESAILRANHLRREGELRPGHAIKLPCLEAVYHPESGEDLDSLAAYFCYRDGAELAAVADLAKPHLLYRGQGLALPGWRYLFAEPGHLFEDIDEQLGLPRGWARPAEQTLHDDATRAYPGEVVAVPSPEFVAGHRLKRHY